jgi:hypothetical protein
LASDWRSGATALCDRMKSQISIEAEQAAKAPSAELLPAQATLYRAAVSLAAQETQLIWTRYTGFIIMNGFLVTALVNEKIREQSEVLGLLGVIALVLNCVWHVLNYTGWHNQHLLYRLAGNLFDFDLGLLTDSYRKGKLYPDGPIYWLAQGIPMMFSLMALPCVAKSVHSFFDLRTTTSWLVSSAVWIVSAASVLLLEYKLLRTPSLAQRVC